MHGEAFLGPLPDHYQSISVLDERDLEYYYGFLDHQTGKTQYRDPRFEALFKADGDEEGVVWEYSDGSQS